MQKWGKNRNGSVRFRCPRCSKTRTRKRQDLTKKYQFELFVSWLLGKQTVEELALEKGVTARTVRNWFAPFWQVEPQPKFVDVRNLVLVIDGKFVEQNATVLVICSPRSVVTWLFTQRENEASWSSCFAKVVHFPKAVVCDGQRGMLKAIRERFPGVIIQRCQFHVIKYCTAKLTQKPESVAAKELRELVLQVAKIKTKEQAKIWLTDYKTWYQTHHKFLKERTYQEDSFTPTGKRRWHYTHGRLHAAHSHLKNALPNLFHYLNHPEIPNTTNFVEGGINAPMQEQLRRHRGLNLLKRRVLIAHFLKNKQS